jgi:2-methylcitrate dehydratase PrpD
MDAAYDISKFLVNTKFDDLPTEAIHVIKKDTLDILANALGGSSDQGVKAIYDLVREWGGKPESSIIGYGTKVPSPNAALVNSTMAFTLDYDDVHERGHFHAGVSTIPSAFAISGMKEGVTGKEFIAAICLAIELGCRLGIASKRAKPGYIMGGWDYASLHGCFTSAAVAGRLLNLDEPKMHNALGLAYHQAAGSGQSAIDAADTKKLGPGFGARAGITSALMAQRGITGAKAIFDESEISFCHLYHSGCDKDVLIRDLGKTFEMLDMSFKPYPSCRLGHAHIDAVLRLVQEHDIEAEEVQEIIPSTCQFVNVQLCAPLEAKKKPGNRTVAQFSLPWVVACAVVRRKVGIHEFTEDALKDRILLDMAAKVNPILDPLLPDEFAFTPLRIKTKRGTFESMTDYGYGSVQNPMTFEAIEEKFMDCASISVKPILKGNLAKVIQMIRNLEEVKDINEIISLLTPFPPHPQ